MSGAFAPGKSQSIECEHPSLCCFIVDRKGKQTVCNEAAFNAVYRGHNMRAVPYISYYCDQHNSERPA